MASVILVPWRGGEFRRERNWDIAQPYLWSLGWPIYLGDSEGDWSRGRAVNAAAKAAGDWEVAFICDADTIGEENVIRKAARLAVQTQGAIRPHDHLWALSPMQTEQVIATGVDSLTITFKTQENLGGGLLVVSRAAWDKVGGYDERFVTWGHEDSDLHTRLLAEAHWDRIEGNAYHLWHERDTKQTIEVMNNRRMMHETQDQYADVIARESEKRGWDVGSVL